ncbi:MAG: hypothetical protein COA45_04605 [Zetaproteobacteria bacterium]|nr:MAG: hypothetical protein COA45_04605 [Zetaproteobacteria bacterium]
MTIKNNVNLGGAFPPCESLNEDGRVMGVVAGDSVKNVVAEKGIAIESAGDSVLDFQPDGL